MPRDRDKVRLRLQEAALELYRANGFDETTTATIAERAGVTERTFFRHFADKREVLFDGEAALAAILTETVRAAPPALGAWAMLFRAFQATKPLLVENRHLAESRRHVIAKSAPLQERELAKAMSLTVKLAAALRERGIPDGRAFLAAQIGIAAFGQAFTLWLDGHPSDLDEHLAKTFSEVHDLTYVDGLLLPSSLES